jgi:hypothetical protein
MPRKKQSAKRKAKTSVAANPESAAIERKPYHAPTFLGGGTAMPANFLPESFVNASEPKPAEHYVAEFRSFRTAPEGQTVRCVRYQKLPTLAPTVVSAMRKNAERVLAAIAADDARALVAREGLFFGIRKNRCGRR